MKKLPSHPMEDAEPTSYVRELLDAGRAEGAEGYDVDAGLARHAALVQANAPLPEWAEGLTREALAAGGAAVGAGTSLGVKLLPWLMAPVVTAGVVAAVVLSAPDRTARTVFEGVPQAAAPAPSMVEPSAQPVEEPAPGIVIEETELAPNGESASVRVKREVLARRAQAHASGEKAAPSSAGAKPSHAGAKSIDALMQRSLQSSAGKVALAERATSSASSQAASDEEASADEAEAPAEAAVAPAPKPVVDDARLEREMGMLATAQRVLKSDPARALRLARQGEQEFAGSMFTQERQQVLLLALIELGQLPEAKRLALPYLKRYPNGPFSDRLRKALATGRVEN